MNEEFVYIKLVTGETLMALKQHEDKEVVTVKFPMLVKMHVVSTRDGKVSEQVTAGPYSLFVDDTTLNIRKQHIVFNSKLAQKAIPHYIHLVQDHEGVTLKYTKEQLHWEDDIEDKFLEEAYEDLAEIEDVKAAIAQLKSIAQEEVEDIEEDKIYVEGNETLH